MNSVIIHQAAVFYGDDDPYVTQAALCDLAHQLRVQPHITGGRHLNTERGFTAFPAVLQAALEVK